jgi:hypothetical protein
MAAGAGGDDDSADRPSGEKRGREKAREETRRKKLAAA